MHICFSIFIAAIPPKHNRSQKMLQQRMSLFIVQRTKVPLAADPNIRPKLEMLLENGSVPIPDTSQSLRNDPYSLNVCVYRARYTGCTVVYK